MTQLEPLPVGVLGARGRMGTEVCRAVDEAPDLEVVAMVESGDGLFSVSDAGARCVYPWCASSCPAATISSTRPW